MTRTVRDNDQKENGYRSILITDPITFYPRTKQVSWPSRFIGSTREKNETAEDIWTRILQV